MTNRFCPLLLCIVLTGCGGAEVRGGETGYRPDPRPLATTMVYACGAYQFTARLGPGDMAVWLPDRYVILSRVRSESGVMYEEGDIQFWSAGEETTLSLGQEAYAGCALVPEQVPWEDARRRGVDFRAVGNEPGWSLEIQSGRHLLFVGDYGMLRVLTPDPGQNSNGQARVYHAVTETNDLRVEIMDESCNDSMTGEGLPSTVAITVNGSTFYGCGRSLDHPWE